MEGSGRDSGAGFWRGALVDAIAPVVVYAGLHRLGVSDFAAMLLGGAVAVASTAVNSIRRRRLDAVGLLVLAEIAVSITLLAWTRDPRILLIKPALYTGVGGLYVLGSAIAERPLSYAGSEPMAKKGGPERVAAFHRAWEQSAEFRGAHRVVTALLGGILLADSAARVAVVYELPVRRAVWMANLPNLVSMILLILLSALAGRRFAALVDRQQQMEGEGAEVRPPAEG